MASNTKFILFGLFFTLLIAPFELSAQEQIIVGKVGGQEVTYQELINNYSMGGSGSATYEKLEEFLPIYLNYRAKLIEAREKGYYEDSTLIAEHKQYAKQAAYSYWLQNEVRPAVFKEFKSRSEIELKAFHILIALPPNATLADEEEVKATLNRVREQILDGGNLEELNEEYSTVRGGRSMGGELPWISAGRTVKPFEDQAYNLEIGEVSEPFKTQFGYHIVLLQDIRDRIPARQTKHIYIRTTNDSSDIKRIEEAYAGLESGDSWEETVRSYSEDGASARNGGNIGWISYQENFNPDFIDAIMSADPQADYTEPVNTSYGYHIFRIDSVETYASEEARDEALMNELNESQYLEENNGFVLNYLQNNLPTENNSSAISAYESWITSFDTLRISQLPPLDIRGNQMIYTIDNMVLTVSDFHNYISNTHDNKPALAYNETWFESFTQYGTDDLIVELTIKNYPEFENQVNNYRDGLVVYNINEDEIWSAATVDTSRLKSIYEENIETYSYGERPFYYLLTARADSTIEKAITFVNKGGIPDSLRANISGLSVTIDSTSTYFEPPFDRVQSMDEQSFSEMFEYDDRKAIFWLEERLPARAMTFEEAFSRLISDFQPQREQEWADELRRKYNIQPDFGNLKEAFQQES